MAEGRSGTEGGSGLAGRAMPSPPAPRAGSRDPPCRQRVKPSLLPPYPHSEGEETEAQVRDLACTSYQAACDAGCHRLSAPGAGRCSER